MTNNLYLETDVRGLEHEIAKIVKEVLSYYGITLTDIVRIVARELSIAITDKLYQIVKEYYDKYKEVKKW
jgi:hypothetical protein